MRLIGKDPHGEVIRYLVYGNGLMRSISREASNRYAGPSMGTEDKPVDKDIVRHLKAVDEAVRKSMGIPLKGW